MLMPNFIEMSKRNTYKIAIGYNLQPYVALKNTIVSTYRNNVKVAVKKSSLEIP